jgi:hypothetical protein
MLIGNTTRLTLSDEESHRKELGSFKLNSTRDGSTRSSRANVSRWWIHLLTLTTIIGTQYAYADALLNATETVVPAAQSHLTETTRKFIEFYTDLGAVTTQYYVISFLLIFAHDLDETLYLTCNCSV